MLTYRILGRRPQLGIREYQFDLDLPAWRWRCISVMLDNHQKKATGHYVRNVLQRLRLEATIYTRICDLQIVDERLLLHKYRSPLSVTNLKRHRLPCVLCRLGHSNLRLCLQ